MTRVRSFSMAVAAIALPQCGSSRWLTATVAAGEHAHPFVFNGKQDTVEMRLAAIKQLAHFKRNGSIFGRKRTTLRHLRKRVDGFSQSAKPVQSGFTSILRAAIRELCRRPVRLGR